MQCRVLCFDITETLLFYYGEEACKMLPRADISIAANVADK